MDYKRLRIAEYGLRIRRPPAFLLESAIRILQSAIGLASASNPYARMTKPTHFESALVAKPL
jgi:hypothetical protein